MAPYSLPPPTPQWLAEASGWRCHLLSKVLVAAAKWHNDLFQPKMQRHPHLLGQGDTALPHLCSRLTSDSEARCPGHQDHGLLVIKGDCWLHIKDHVIIAKAQAPAPHPTLSKIPQQLWETVFSFLPFRWGR